MQSTEINWGYNCLTVGVHHGRPEEIWNLPLAYAHELYNYIALPAKDPDVQQHVFREIVVSRIYNDAMQFVEHSDDITGNKTFTATQEWAERVRDLAAQKFHTVLYNKLEELRKYYRSPMFRRDVKMVIEQLEKDKLYRGHKPLHPHDTVNMLCRILGVSCSIEAAKS